MRLFSALSNNRVTIFFTRLSIYGLMTVMLAFYGLGKIKDSHENLAHTLLQHIESSNPGIFRLVTPHIAVQRSSTDADYYRELASEQLGPYQQHILLNWTVDLNSLLATGTLPIELYYQSHYQNGSALQSFRVEGALNPTLVSQSILIE